MMVGTVMLARRGWMLSLYVFSSSHSGLSVGFQALSAAACRRWVRILYFNVTAHPTAEWTGQQLREAFPFEQVPRYLLRDRDAIFGEEFRRQVTDMGIHEVLSAPRAPWQRNG